MDDLKYIREALNIAAEDADLVGHGFLVITRDGDVFSPTLEELCELIADLKALPTTQAEIH